VHGGERRRKGFVHAKENERTKSSTKVKIMDERRPAIKCRRGEKKEKNLVKLQKGGEKTCRKGKKPH